VSTTPRDEAANAEASGRYVGIAFVDGEVYIYDADRPTAWIQSDAGVALDRMR
jgi:hypothetical protein